MEEAGLDSAVKKADAILKMTQAYKNIADTGANPMQTIDNIEEEYLVDFDYDPETGGQTPRG